jgi:TonB family protein
MAKREKFGKFVLLEEVDSSGVGSEFRAAKLGATGLEKIVTVVRLNPSLASHPELAKGLMDQVKFAAQLQNPNILKIHGIGKVESAYYISYEFLEGKTLRTIFQRCRQEGFPLSTDHALLIASKICSALEYAHGRKAENGQRYAHGDVTPSNVLVSYEGEVRIRGFGHAPSRIREAGVAAEEDALYLAPEQVGGEIGDHRSDIFAVGAILFETLTGQPLFQGGRTDDVAGRLAQAKLQSPTSDDDSIPKPIADILTRALGKEPGQRFGEMQEMRKAIDTLLFSGDFTPTTFNLAFFMHSLFREDIERESRQLKEDKDGSYVEFLGDEKARAATHTPVPVSATQPPSDTAATLVHPAATAAAAAAATAPVLSPPPVHAEKHPPAEKHAAPHHHEPAPHVPSPSAPSRDAAAGFTFHKDEQPKSKAPLVVGVAAVLLIGAGVAFMMSRKGGSAPEAGPASQAAAAPTTLTPEGQAALAKVKELEDKLAALEAERAAAETKAAEDAKKKIEQQAAAKGTAVDPAALAAAQEEARKKAQAEQQRKLAEEQKRLEEEQKAAEARLAEEQKRAAEEAARLAAAATPPPTTVPPTTQAARLAPGSLVNLSDSGVIEPILETSPPLVYPPIAQRQKVEGVVELRILVDEKGKVSDAQVVTGAGGKAGLNEAAIDMVRKRKYRAATKDGVPVKVWVPVRVRFALP